MSEQADAMLAVVEAAKRVRTAAHPIGQLPKELSALGNALARLDGSLARLEAALGQKSPHHLPPEKRASQGSLL